MGISSVFSADELERTLEADAVQHPRRWRRVQRAARGGALDRATRPCLWYNLRQ